jgi:glycosyltransferase involved in cell wall biosynthesis
MSTKTKCAMQEINRKLLITHIITDLEVGGAEVMLYRLLLNTDKSRFSTNVVSLTNVGPIGKKIQASDVPVSALGMRRGVPDPMAVVRLSNQIRRMKPAVVQTWMYHADLLGGVAAKLATGVPVVWGIHHTTLSDNKRSTILVAKVCARLSKWIPNKIVCCSRASRTVHAELGYEEQKMVVIPNGFDLDCFRPDSKAQKDVRDELNLPDTTLLIGLMGRFHLQKDHHNFIKAAARLHGRYSDVHFVLCGDDVAWNNPDLVAWIDSAGIRKRCHLLGRRDDMSRLQASLDIATTASCSGEAFPLVIGEAMACGVPCVVTNLGDSAHIIGDTGLVVPPKDPEALAQAWGKILSLAPQDRLQLGERARQRIRENFDLHSIVRRYEELYESVLRG